MVYLGRLGPHPLLIERWERGEVPTVAALFEPELPSYEETYHPGTYDMEIEHLRSRVPGCFCPICEEELKSIQSDLWLMKEGIL